MARGRKDYEKAVIAVESEGYKDLHGRILMQDDFEDTPLKWAGTGAGTHFESRQATAAYNGSFGAELFTAADPGSGLRRSTITRLILTDVTERLRIEYFWRADDLTAITYLYTYLRFHDGERRHTAALQYIPALARWDYRNGGGIYEPIPGGNQTFYNDAWNELTLDIDFSTDRYIRLKSNNVEINMGGLAMGSALSGLGAHLYTQISSHNSTLNQLRVSLDDAVIKELER